MFQKQAQSTPRLFICSLCLRVCSLSGSHNQMRLTVPTKTHCCCLTCVRATFSLTKKSARWLSLSKNHSELQEYWKDFIQEFQWNGSQSTSDFLFERVVLTHVKQQQCNMFRNTKIMDFLQITKEKIWTDLAFQTFCYHFSTYQILNSEIID
jgi:hypothetical protein